MVEANEINTSHSTLTALSAGAVAGVSVDCILFPLDTIKTRLQSEAGFIKSGGFKRIYAGIGSSVVGSAPNAAAFFVTYEGTKRMLRPHLKLDAAIHMAAASCGEVAACLIRVPVEVVKQRTQASRKTSSWYNLTQTLNSQGIRGLYRGYFTTVMREIPFSLIQFPLWEFLKKSWAQSSGVNRIDPWQSTICGAFSGGFSAFLTTPLDVAKTRIILAEKESRMASGNVIYAIRTIYKEKQVRGLFAGVVPRVLWISIGGAIFLGGYEKTAQLLESQ